MSLRRMPVWYMIVASPVLLAVLVFTVIKLWWLVLLFAGEGLWQRCLSRNRYRS